MMKFKLFYDTDPEDFNVLFNLAFSDLANELLQNKIQVIDIKGDYLFIKGNLPKNSMLIPIREISKYSKKEPEDAEDSEPNLFEMPQDNHA